MLSIPLGQYQTALRAWPGFAAPEQTTAAVAAAAAAVAADMTDSLDAAGADNLHADAAAAGLALAAACPAAADA